MMERGVIEQINTRGRVTLRLPDRVVVADLNNGSGGCVGDTIEGDMRPGLRSWRNVGNGILSVVTIVAVHALADNDDAADHGDVPAPATHTADRNNRRKLS